MSIGSQTVALGETVRVRNLGTEPRVLAYNSVRIVIPPGGEAVMPREAAVIHFGDWTLRGKARQEEYGRIRTLYGTTLGNPVDVSQPGLGEQQENVPSDLVWAQTGKWGSPRKPQVEIYDFATGQQVPTVIDDPEGDTLPVEAAPDLMRQLQMMEQQMDIMRKQIASQEQVISAPAPEDTPETAAYRRPGKARVEAATRRDGDRIVRDD